MSDKEQKFGDYEVGYGRPPKFSQWKKGQTGNPRGSRKKLEPSRTQLQIRNDILDSSEEPIRVTVNGKIKTITAFQAFIQRVRGKAISGDRHAGDIYFTWIRWAMEGHVEANPDVTATVEKIHRALNENGDALSSESIEYLNKMHRSTRGKML